MDKGLVSIQLHYTRHGAGGRIRTDVGKADGLQDRSNRPLWDTSKFDYYTSYNDANLFVVGDFTSILPIHHDISIHYLHFIEERQIKTKY